ncbi:MAG: SH3 domain-containing protein [Myxococcota bacterium]|nr:SH3 domain-containing protein [Myxococcales bacterium]
MRSGRTAEPAESTEIDAAVYRRAESVRAERLGREVERLRADLRQAEEALIAAESGMRGNHSRADAVSSLAEARIEVERAARRTPWRRGEIDEARSKLDDADAQVEKANFGAAMFFVYSAKRIAQGLEREASVLADAPDARFVLGQRVNLRSGPSTHEAVVDVLNEGTPVFAERSGDTWTLVRTLHGEVGWVHSSLLAHR